MSYNYINEPKISYDNDYYKHKDEKQEEGDPR